MKMGAAAAAAKYHEEAKFQKQQNVFYARRKEAT